ncbi:MAG: hypothetical protein QOH76_3095 [Thermoleophilaceae bacterium]|jgi:hypothetical protein|nr:hypothetical protein [Thermoleophilaceae bacterium]
MAPAALTIVGVAALLRVLYDPWYLNYDARYALLWARDVWHGFLPDFQADFAPTPHPLSTAVSSLGLPFGHGGDTVVVWIVLLSFGALVWLTYRLGAVLFSRWVGVAAAVVVLTRPVLDRDVLLAYQDVPFAALIVGAVLLEAQRRRRGVPVLVLLTLAGLLRPEAWVLAGLYVLWMWPACSARQRLGLVGLAAVAPVVWALVDLIVTGDPLHSLHGTAALAEEVDRRRHVDQVPRWTLTYFAFTLREPITLGIPIGLAFAARHFRRRAVLPLAVAVVMTLVFAVGPIFGLPLVARYIRTPAVLLTLFYGLALFGWLSLPRGRERMAWGLAALLVFGLFAYFAPKNVKMLDGLRLRSSREGRFYEGLRRAGEAPAVRAAFARCAPLTATDHRPIPYIRWWLDGDPGSVGTVENGASPLGRLLLTPRRTRLTSRFYQENFPRYTPPRSYRVLYQNRNWRVYAAAGC